MCLKIGTLKTNNKTFPSKEKKGGVVIMEGVFISENKGVFIDD